MRTAVYGLCVAIGLSLSAAPVLAASDIPAVLERAMAVTKVPAMAVIEIRDGKAQPPVVRGVRRIDRPDAAGPQDRWHLGSDAKAMTATLVAGLVDEGKLSWTARLDEMLPDLAADMRPEYRDVTLVDLMSHQSGLPENVAEGKGIEPFYDDRRPLPEQRLDYIRQGLAEAPAYKARTEMQYSNTGFILAGLIAERAGGKPYETLMVERVFRPLGITSARFDPAGAGEPAGHVDGKVAGTRDANPPMINPAGGLRMTMQDWARFCIDQIKGPKGGGKLLKPETYAFMQKSHGQQEGGGWAFGWGVAPSALGRQGPALTHSGSDGNWYAIVILYPASNSGVLVAANAADSMGGDKATVAAARELAADLAPPKPAS